jgi:hypothetical protein
VTQLGLRFDLSYTGDYATNSLVGGNDVVLTVEQFEAVPEPGSTSLFALSLALVVGWRFRPLRVGSRDAAATQD